MRPHLHFQKVAAHKLIAKDTRIEHHATSLSRRFLRNSYKRKRFWLRGKGKHLLSAPPLKQNVTSHAYIQGWLVHNVVIMVPASPRWFTAKKECFQCDQYQLPTAPSNKHSHTSFVKILSLSATFNLAIIGEICLHLILLVYNDL